jgi:hypothetical protein
LSSTSIIVVVQLVFFVKLVLQLQLVFVERLLRRAHRATARRCRHYRRHQVLLLDFNNNKRLALHNYDE